MRLIDADKLSDHIMHSGVYDISANDVLELIDEQPTIGTESVQHGWWAQRRDIPSLHSCSLCHYTGRMRECCNYYILPNYCPNCGAQMEN